MVKYHSLTQKSDIRNILIWELCGTSMQAIEAYTTALKAQAVDPSVLLSNRCAAYCRSISAALVG